MKRLIFVFLMCGCADGKSTLRVIADAETGTLTGIKELRVTVTGPPGRSDPITVAVEGGTLPPERRFALRFDANVRGVVNLLVDAMPATGDIPITSKAVDVEITPSTDRELPLKLPPPGSGTPVKLAFLVQPANSAVGSALMPAPQVALQTASAATAATSSAAVTVKIGDNPANGTLGGTLTVNAVNGIATFADLKIDTNGKGYTLVASSPQVASATSAAFDITPPLWVPSSSGIFGGSLTILQLDPKFTPTIYAGTRDSGVHKTIDGGVTWKAVNTGLPRAAIVGLALDPVTTATLYALTDTRGVYRTTNGGTSWAAINTGFPPDIINRGTIAVDPGHPTYVLAAVNNRVFRTTDSGANWAEFTTGIVASGPGNTSFCFDGNSGVVYLTNYGTGLYKSTYNGTTWAPTGGAGLTGTSKYFTSVVHDRGNTLAFYLASEVGSALYRSVDNGATWNAVVTSLPTFGVTLAGGTGTAKPMYAGAAGSVMGVFSSDDGTTWNKDNGINERVSSVVVDEVDAKIAYAATPTGVFKTTDGFNWSYRSGTLTGNPITALAIDPKMPSRLFAGVKNQGLYRSTDSGMTWAQPPMATAIPSSANVTGIVVNEADSQKVFASTTNGTYLSTDGGTTWILFPGSSGRFSVASGSNVSAWSGDTGTAWRISSGDGMWTQAGGGLPGANDLIALATHPTDQMQVYAATTASGVYRTLNAGALWSANNTGLTSMAMTALAIDRSTPNTLFAGTSDQGVFKSTDGAMWSAASAGLTSMSVTALAIARSKSSTVYVGTLANGVFQSSDGGTTWTGMSAGLGSTSISALAVDPMNPLVIYAGTWDGGIFKSAP